jgi:hypothetical protein
MIIYLGCRAWTKSLRPVLALRRRLYIITDNVESGTSTTAAGSPERPCVDFLPLDVDHLTPAARCTGPCTRCIRCTRCGGLRQAQTVGSSHGQRGVAERSIRRETNPFPSWCGDQALGYLSTGMHRPSRPRNESVARRSCSSQGERLVRYLGHRSSPGGHCVRPKLLAGAKGRHP